MRALRVGRKVSFASELKDTQQESLGITTMRTGILACRFRRVRLVRTAWVACTVAVLAPVAALAQSAAAPTLTPNQQSALNAIAAICPKLGALNKAQQLDPTEQQLFFRCNTILNQTTGLPSRNAALTAISPEELNAAPRANIDFGTAQSASLVSRLLTLREGSGTLGGSSGDESSSLSDGKLGTFFNIKDGFGSKDATANESEYDVKSKAATLGADYRITSSFVAGVALGYGWNKADFAVGGDLKTEGEMGSVYGSWYGEHQSLDLIATFGSFSNDSARQITYDITSPARTDDIASTAYGTTRSHMTAAGLSYSYDFGQGGWRFGPTLAVDYLHVNVHAFSESSAQNPELDLSYMPQGGISVQIQPGFNVAYSLSTHWGVLTPYLRAVYVRETKTGQDSFEVRYLNDTKVAAEGVNTAFSVVADSPDRSYFRVAEGASMTFANNFSGFLDVESLLGYTSVKYSEVALGVRYQFH
jgi:uncharacterized protein YhjY with autotransporter beta-barrel domain